MGTAFESDSEDRELDTDNNQKDYNNDIENPPSTPSVHRGKHYKQNNSDSISIQELLKRNGREIKEETDSTPLTKKENYYGDRTSKTGMQKMMANKGKNPSKRLSSNTKTTRRIIDEKNVQPIDSEISNNLSSLNVNINSKNITQEKTSPLSKGKNQTTKHNDNEMYTGEDSFENVENEKNIIDDDIDEIDSSGFSLDGLDETEDDVSAYGIREQGKIHRDELEAIEKEKKKREERRSAIEKSQFTRSLDENILKGDNKKTSIQELNVPLGGFVKHSDSQGKVTERYLKLQEGHELPNIPFDKRVEVLSPISYGFKTIFKSFFSYLMYAFISIFTFVFCWGTPLVLMSVFFPIDSSFFSQETVENISSIFSLSNFFEIVMVIFGVISFSFAVGALTTINASLGLQDIDKENINDKVTIREILSGAQWKNGILSTMFIILFNIVIISILLLCVYIVEISILYKMLIFGIIALIYLLLTPAIVLAPYYAIEKKATITGALTTCFNDVKKAFGSSFISIIVVNFVSNILIVMPIVGLLSMSFNSIGIAHIYRQVSHGYAPHV